MAIYKISELLDVLNGYKKKHLEYVEIYELEADDEFAASLSVNGIVDELENIEDSIDSVEL